MKYIELKEFLLSNADKKFSEFSKTLSNSDYKVVGVKNPILIEDQIQADFPDDSKNSPEIKIVHTV